MFLVILVFVEIKHLPQVIRIENVVNVNICISNAAFECIRSSMKQLIGKIGGFNSHR